jgi:hypothetical protein
MARVGKVLTQGAKIDVGAVICSVCVCVWCVYVCVVCVWCVYVCVCMCVCEFGLVTCYRICPKLDNVSANVRKEIVVDTNTQIAAAKVRLSSEIKPNFFHACARFCLYM